jgi:hypothetical protein
MYLYSLQIKGEKKKIQFVPQRNHIKSPLQNESGLKPIYMEVCCWALLFVPLVILHHLLNVSVQLSNKRGLKKCIYLPTERLSAWREGLCSMESTVPVGCSAWFPFQRLPFHLVSIPVAATRFCPFRSETLYKHSEAFAALCRVFDWIWMVKRADQPATSLWTSNSSRHKLDDSGQRLQGQSSAK